MTRYVVGLLFTDDRKNVVLLRKARPWYMAGKWCGPGGQVEEGETPVQAMRREFQEESGVDFWNWKPFAVLHGNDFKIHFFRGFSTYHAERCETMTDEPVVLAPVETTTGWFNNMTWLVPMALSMDRDRAMLFEINEFYEQAAELKKRTTIYIQRPREYSIPGHPVCGNADPDWSEYIGHLWCQTCQVDFRPEDNGIFDGPVLVNVAASMGIDLRRIDIVTGTVLGVDDEHEL